MKVGKFFMEEIMSKQGDSGFTQGLLLGTIIGGAIGAITALLFAPKSGAELRKDIAMKSQELYDKTTDYLYSAESNFGSAITNTINQGKIKAQEIIDSAKLKANEILANAEELLQEAKMKAQSSKEHFNEKVNTLKDATKASIETFKNELNK